MTTIAPSHMRSEVNDGPYGLAFTIPTRRHWLLIVPLAMWLALWSIGLLFNLVGGLLAGSIIPLLTWFVFGLPFLVVCVWLLVGKEKVTMRGSTLTHRYEWALGLGRERVYDLSQVRNLRVSPPPSDFWAPRSALRMLDLAGGAISFDYGARTVQFGTGIDEPEARMIIDRLNTRYPIPSA